MAFFSEDPVFDQPVASPKSEISSKLAEEIERSKSPLILEVSLLISVNNVILNTKTLFFCRKLSIKIQQSLL